MSNTENDPFGNPSESASSGEGFAARDFLGKHVMFLGHEKEKFDGGDFKPTDVARCQLILVLDSDEGVMSFTDALVFGAGLAPTVYRSSKPVVFGMIGQGEAKAGKSAPWTLEDADEVARAAAIKFYNEKITVSSAGAYFYSPDEAPF